MVLLRNHLLHWNKQDEKSTSTKLTLYQVETVPVPILDASSKILSYTQLKIEKPYIALNDEMYITIHPKS